MKEVEMTIHNPTGLHARPAKVFVNTAKKFNSDIRVLHGEKKANAKSLISMLTLGAEQGAQIRITVEGDDEEQALSTLEAAVRSGLGEEIGGTDGEGGNRRSADGTEERVPTERATAPAIAPVERARVASSGDRFKGIAAAPGIAIGPLFVHQAEQIEVDESGFAGAETEGTRLTQAREEAHGELEALQAEMATRAPEEAAIFEVHSELLDDPDLLESVQARIASGENAAVAWQGAIKARADAVAALKDPLLAERAADLRDVGQRVLRLLVGAGETRSLPQEPAVIVAQDLSPSDTARLSGMNVLGFCTAAGGPTAHAAIIARALRLPAVVSAGPAVLSLQPGTTVILDGNAGSVTVDPDERALAEAREAQRQWQAAQETARAAAGEPAVTADGTRIEVVANIGGAEDARAAAASGAEGVGLLRTEFLFLGRTEPPSEGEQEAVYREIVVALGGQPVIVRTLDIGGDKPLPYIDVPEEANPFLGERGIRLCLARPSLLRQQVRAILRAAADGPVRIMFPMVADLNEWRQARAIVEEERAAVGTGAVELGIMIEIPAAALLADHFAREVDFFSIGTNDLTQYTLAMDRMHPTLAAQSDGLHPAVLRLIERTASAAHAEGKWVGVCGELAADPQAVPILVGLGVDELSVTVPAVAGVKAQIRTLKMEAARTLAQRALACADARQVRALSAGEED